jgi:predicted aspartyl protease
MRYWITLLLLLSAVLPSQASQVSDAFAAAAAAAAEPTRFRLRGSADVVLPVWVNGSGPFQFLLDTGSGRSAISERVARLAPPPTARTSMVTPSGRTERWITRLQRVTIGSGDDTADVDVIILPGDDLGHGIDGLIGQDVLASLTYTIDYERRHIVWHPSQPSIAGTRLPLEWSEGRMMVSLVQKSARCAPLRLVPDSGSDGWVFVVRRDRPLPAFTPVAAVALRTLSGQRAARSVVMDEVDVGEIRLRNQVAVVIDDQLAGAFGDGLLPLHIFARVTFNGPEKYLIVHRR